MKNKLCVVFQKKGSYEGTVEEDAIDVDFVPPQPAENEELPAEPAESAYSTLEAVESVTALPNSTEIENLTQQYSPVVEERQKKGIGHTDQKTILLGKKCEAEKGACLIQ